jgi:hypothetical protein
MLERARAWPRVPTPAIDGKEGVSGSSPEEGSRVQGFVVGLGFWRLGEVRNGYELAVRGEDPRSVHTTAVAGVSRP